jgi:hypothetical protein
VRRRAPEPDTRMGARADEPRHHGVALSDQLHDLQLKIAERTRNGANPRPGSGCRAGSYSSSNTSSRHSLNTSATRRCTSALRSSVLIPVPAANMITTTPTEPASVPAKSYRSGRNFCPNPPGCEPDTTRRHSAAITGPRSQPPHETSHTDPASRGVTAAGDQRPFGSRGPACATYRPAIGPKHWRGTLIGLCGVGAAMLDRFRNRLSAL